MKKLVLLLSLIIVLAVAGVYYFIPGNLTVSETITVHCVADAAFRNLSNDQNWNKWWPGSTGINHTDTTGKHFRLTSNTYSVAKKNPNNFEILIENKKGVISSEMNLLRLPHDSTLIRWKCSLPASSNFFARIASYRVAVSIKENMHDILTAAQNHLSKFENVYGFAYLEASTADTLLITTKSVTAAYPTTGFVYTLINKLRNFCVKEGCSVTGTPMLNVTALNPSGYQIMVALPVNRFMLQKDSVSGVKMVQGKFIITDVTGGPHTIEQMHQQVLNYFRDYRRMSMAIPFEYLITDRQKEKDTSKWLTRIYSPVY